ncbi:antitoxin Xre/MbcA/ParS toxin-binding domain-containing protein [Thalassotalea euphylliae]|uniref:antitoxin Xre/MbcA/ParS toxin-binding domain-containing protein n=1 Tax=Thalassotalea euphylliae TaxID=1655234 RepID=UPI0036337C21
MKTDELAYLLRSHPEIHKAVLEVFKRDDVALRWLRAPRVQLGHKTPIEALEGDESMVLDLLFRIKTGDLS